jgi:hypothetical protein
VQNYIRLLGRGKRYIPLVGTSEPLVYVLEHVRTGNFDNLGNQRLMRIIEAMTEFAMLIPSNISYQMIENLFGSQHIRLFKSIISHYFISYELKEDALYRLLEVSEQPYSK